jgi:hypothetical protein
MMLVLLTLIPTGWRIVLAFSDLLESLTRHTRCKRNR